MGLLGSALELGGDIYSAKIQAREAKRQRDYEQAQFNKQFAEQKSQFGQEFGLKKQQDAAKQRAYQQALQSGAAGEQGLMAATQAGTPADIEQMRQDMIAGNKESIGAGASQIQAGLAQQGVRGGQAATQLSRGVGSMALQGQRDINQMIAQEEARKRALQGAYQSQKAIQGYGAGY